jgi:RNA polymerase-binding protein DksA
VEGRDPAGIPRHAADVAGGERQPSGSGGPGLVELRARDRQRKLISKIDAALQRIDDNTYGYCEETGEPISLKRLEARPIATLSVEAQERHEKREKVYRDE